MSSSILDDRVNQIKRRLDQTIDAVLDRGYDDLSEEVDDYSILLERFEFRKLVTFQLYEVYFPAKRHEFELRIVTDIVEAVATSKGVAFLGTAALSGVVGSAAYKLTKKLLSHVVSKFKKNKKRSDPFRDISRTLEKIHQYFKNREHARLQDMASDLDAEPQRIEPLLKLLGFKCRRTKKRQVWIRPQEW